MMLGEQSKSGDYWKKCGDEALVHGIKHVVMMVRRSGVFLIHQVITTF